MTFRPLRGRVAIREEEDKVTEGRHRLEGVRLKGLGARQEERHDGARGLDAFDSVRGDAQANANGASGRRRFHLRLPAEDDGDEETVPRAPRVQRPAVDPEPVRHLPDSEPTKADDPSLLVRVGEAPEIWVLKQFVDRVRRSLQGFRELRPQDRLTVGELTIDLEP